MALYRSTEVTQSRNELRYGPSIWRNLMVRQSRSPPWNRGEVRVQAISGTSVRRAVSRSATERCTRNMFIREIWDDKPQDFASFKC